jgi:hypothetical protein
LISAISVLACSSSFWVSPSTRADLARNSSIFFANLPSESMNGMPAATATSLADLKAMPFIFGPR